jgi:hypothetical protein
LSSIAPIAEYFAAERAESIVFILVGAVALGLSFMFWFKLKTPLTRGAAWPLALVAAIQLTVGTTIYVRSPLDAQRVQHVVQKEPARVRSEEIPRMQTVMRKFEQYRYLEMALLAVGAVLGWRARRGSLWQGVGFGLAAQAGLMLAMDFFAERRGAAYLQWLQALPA